MELNSDAAWRAVYPSFAAFTSAPPSISNETHDALLAPDAAWRAVNPLSVTAFTSTINLKLKCKLMS